MLIGHIGIALLQHRYLDAGFKPAIAGSLFPDALDKTLCQVLRLTPSGRMWGHTALSAVISTVAVRALTGKRTARDWFLGYLGHLLADSGGPIPWWYPFRTYTFDPSPDFAEIFRRFAENQTDAILEFALLALGLLALATKRS
jgi:LexA-binding, inner membrane-associated putative hydrolase